MKILYVSQYFPPEMGAPAARVAELSKLWAKRGHEVTVLTGFPNHPTGMVPSEYRKKLHRLVCRERIDEVDVVRTWLLPLPNRKSYERVFSYGSFSASAAATGTFLPRPDVVIATSPQLLAGLSGWWLSRVKRVPFILEIRDLWPESLVAVGKSNSVLYPVLSRIARFLYQVSDHIVVVTSSFKEHLVANWHVPGQKISVIENGVDTGLFRPQGSSEIRAALGEQKFVVSYIGTIGNAHGLETVIDAAAQLQQSAPQILFLLVGEGAEKQRIAALAGQKQLGNVRFVGQQPREKVPAFIAASDACLVLLKGAEIFRTVLPTKMLEFMACARPVIAGVDGLARNVVEQANAGICIQPQNSSELASAILRLASDRGLCRKYGENGHGHVLQNFTREQSASLYLEVLSELLEHNRGFAAAAAGAFS